MHNDRYDGRRPQLPKYVCLETASIGSGCCKSDDEERIVDLLFRFWGFYAPGNILYNAVHLALK